MMECELEPHERIILCVIKKNPQIDINTIIEKCNALDCEYTIPTVKRALHEMQQHDLISSGLKRFSHKNYSCFDRVYIATNEVKD
uniref:Uncharacterized protein n=1 Tax=viral metagenome TaxID=1070528 RepID=A0A6M3X5T0_9ZZZZ